MQRMMIWIAAAALLTAPAAAQNDVVNTAEAANNGVTVTVNEANTLQADEMTAANTDIAMAPAPVETAPAPAPEPSKSRGFPWGVIGLVGLVGLLGRRRRD